MKVGKAMDVLPPFFIISKKKKERNYSGRNELLNHAVFE